MKHYATRIFAAALGLYLALGMSRVSADLLEAVRQAESLKASCRQTQEEIAALRSTLELTDQEVCALAYARWGLVSPGDVVFFDGG